MSMEEAKHLGQEAIGRYKDIAQTFLDQPLNKSAKYLADNGRPLLSTVKSRQRDMESLFQQLTDDGSLEKSRRILREVRSVGAQYGAASAFKQADGSLIVVVPLLGSTELRQKHIRPNSPTLTLTQEGELAVIMIKVGEQWHLQPFAW